METLLCSVRFLRGRKGLAEQVAGCLREVEGGPMEVWIPTQGAARAISHALKKNGIAATRLPVFLQPMEAVLLAACPNESEKTIASRAEREAAWALALREMDDQVRDVLLPSANDEEVADVGRLAGFAGALCDLEDALAEGGLFPGSPELAEICEMEAERWEAIAVGSRNARERLAKAGLECPNALRLQAIRNPLRQPQRLVIAAIPDLPKAAELLATKWIERGVPVEVLVWSPEELPAGFDAWGRPLAQEWNAATLSLRDEEIFVARDLAHEADEAARRVRHNPEKVKVVAPDAEIFPELEAAAERYGMQVFRPGGVPLDRTEPGRLVVLWKEWLDRKRFHVFRRLLDLPAFAQWLERKTNGKWGRASVLQVLDFLSTGALVQDVPGAVSFLGLSDVGYQPDERQMREGARELLACLQALEPSGLEDLLKDLCPIEPPPAETDGTIGAVRDVVAAVANSAVLEAVADEAGTKERLQRAMLLRSLARERYFAPPAPQGIIPHGWLEAPWLDAPVLHVTGCREVTLPGSGRGHPFLPDSVRAKLGLSSLSSRQARDAYLFECLRLARNHPEVSKEDGAFTCSFNRRAADGSPAMPSPFLLRCRAENLPKRVRQCMKIPESAPRAVLANNWRWSLPEGWRKPPPEKISPTDFSVYLRCPLRFYFSRVLNVEPVDIAPREMDARQFGSLVHATLEIFARNHANLVEEKKIANVLFDTLDLLVRRTFGEHPDGAVQVQVEAIRVRLRAFARLQAHLCGEGWRIVDAERKLSAEDSKPLIIGGLKVSAKVDRIDRNEKTGQLRIFDYKTSASGKCPTKTHFTKAGVCPHVRSSEVTVSGKPKSWADLQLPLYHLIARHWYPEIGPENISAAYIVLPAEPKQTDVKEFPLDEQLRQSAMECATEVAEHVAVGHFWPPGEWMDPWDDPLAPLLVNRKPEECFAEETIRFLQGRQ